VTPGSPVALDCEGVILDDNVGWRKCGVGRVSMVNIDNDCIYDSFVFYPPGVRHRPSPQWLYLGVKYKDILPQNGAQAHAKVSVYPDRPDSNKRMASIGDSAIQKTP
jgi:hypothetical protein